MTDSSTTEALDRLLAKIKTKIEIGHFHNELDAFLHRSRSLEELKDTRLRRGRLKKIYDEVFPVRRFLRYSNLSRGHVMFPFDDHVPECWLWRGSAHGRVGIEVTVAQGTERYHLATELVEQGVAPGFIGLSDDDNKEEFMAARARSRIMYSTEHALAAIRSGVATCLKKKNHPKYDGMILLTLAPLESLPQRRWKKVKV